MIECDMALTKDHAIICSHAPYLGQSTDISMKPEFADRLTTYNMDDDDPAVDWNDKGDITDWFSFDFSLEELRSLRVKQVLTFCVLSLFFWSTNLLLIHPADATLSMQPNTTHAVVKSVPMSQDILVAIRTNF